MDFPGKKTGVGCHFLLRGIFPTQGSNRDLPHHRQLLLPAEPPGNSPPALDGANASLWQCPSFNHANKEKDTTVMAENEEQLKSFLLLLLLSHFSRVRLCATP